MAETLKKLSKIIALATYLIYFYIPLSLSEALTPVRIGIAAFPDSDGDPHRSVSVFTAYTWSPIFETLTTFRENGELIGELALSWEQTEPREWQFSLRKNVVFSNGRPLTAHDIVASVNYLKTPHGKTTSTARDLSVVATAHAINNHTVAIRTSMPSAILPRILTALYIVEPDHWESLGPGGFAREPIGSGPFTIESWEEGQVTYLANPRSWRAPKIKRMEVLQLPEVTSRVQALISGDIDIAIGMAPDHISLIESAGGYMHQREPIDVMSITFVIGKGKPVNDIRVRRALNYAVNKEAITNILLSGYSKPATQGAVRGLLGYNPVLQSYPFDPERARTLLRDAGYPNGFTLNIEVIIGSNASDGAIYQLVAANLAAVGVTLRINSIPTSQMVRIILQGKWKGDGFSQVFGAWPTFEPIRTLRLHSCQWPNPWFCDLSIMPKLTAAIAAPNLKKRVELTQDILAFYHDQATTILLHEVPLLDAIGPRIKGYAPNKGKLNYENISIK